MPDQADSVVSDVDSDEGRRLFEQYLSEAPPTLDSFSAYVVELERFLTDRGWTIIPIPGVPVLSEREFGENMGSIMNEDYVEADRELFSLALVRICDALSGVS